MSKTKKILIAIFVAIILLPLTVFGVIYFKMHSVYVEDDSENYELSVSEEESIENNAILDDNITNILIIGSDERSKNERGRSDAMLIATIDEKHKSLKLTSIARDTYVNIPGKGYEKLNHAYSYGGPKLLMKTIEKNFGVGISNYVNINFTSFIDIIDALGGITLNVKPSEIKELNKYIPECYSASSNNHNKPVEYIKKSGVQKLNGYQALSYSRIRKNDSAFQRDGRQREVLQSLLNEVSTMSFGEVTKVANAVLPYVKTNIKPMEMLKYVGKVLKIGNFEIKQLEFPIEEYSKGGILKGKGWVLQFNSEKCLPILHNFIFEDSASDRYMSFIEDYNHNSEFEETIKEEPSKEEESLEKPTDTNKEEQKEEHPTPDNLGDNSTNIGGNSNSNTGESTDGDKKPSEDINKPSKPKPPTKPTPDNEVAPDKPNHPNIPNKPTVPEKPIEPDNHPTTPDTEDNNNSETENNQGHETQKPNGNDSTHTPLNKK